MEYNDSNRGKIQYRDRARQINDLSGLRYNKITPTDVDGMIEYHNKCFAIYEVKYGDAGLSYGQSLALTRLADTIQAGGKPAVVMVVRHDVHDTEKLVDVGNTDVDKFYYAGKWYGGDGRTAREITDSFFAFVEKQPF